MRDWLQRLRRLVEPAPTASGVWAERLAERHLRAHGLRLLARNYRARRGECDLLMEHGEALVFVEVRYRRESAHGSPVDSVDPGKRRRILACAGEYALRHPHAARRDWRFDVVGVSGPREAPTLEWLADAFRGG